MEKQENRTIWRTPTAFVILALFSVLAAPPSYAFSSGARTFKHSKQIEAYSSNRQQNYRNRSTDTNTNVDSSSAGSRSPLFKLFSTYSNNYSSHKSNWLNLSAHTSNDSSRKRHVHGKNSSQNDRSVSSLFNNHYFSKTRGSEERFYALHSENKKNLKNETRNSNSTYSAIKSTVALKVDAQKAKIDTSNTHLEKTGVSFAQIDKEEIASRNAQVELQNSLLKNGYKAEQSDKNMLHKSVKSEITHLKAQIKNKVTISSKESLSGKDQTSISNDTVDTVYTNKSEVKDIRETDGDQEKKIQFAMFGLIPILKSMLMEQSPLIIATTDADLRLPAQENASSTREPVEIPVDAHKTLNQENPAREKQCCLAHNSNLKDEKNNILMNIADIVDVSAVNYVKTGLSPPGNRLASISRIQSAQHKADANIFSYSPTHHPAFDNSLVNHITDSDFSFSGVKDNLTLQRAASSSPLPGMQLSIDLMLDLTGDMTTSFTPLPRVASVVRLPASDSSFNPHNLTGVMTASSSPLPGMQSIARLVTIDTGDRK
ncbi:MAG TPA: hypothetical protein P5110_00980 [Candidatus Omnitrophota bacterium]|nr:hypothetical protein [Candidatus Omnitrophota bacterium]